MARALDVFAVLLLLAAVLAFAAGIRLVGERSKDVEAVYLLIVGALALRASTELLRPRGGAA
jgi:hypothetical protein